MPSIAALTLNDGQTTPVAHTFAPITSNGRKGEWADRSSTTMIGWRTLSNEVLLPVGNSGGAIRNLTRAVLPVEGVVDGQTKVVGQNSFRIEFNFRQEATDQEKKDAYAYAANFLANASVKSAVLAGEPHY